MATPIIVVDGKCMLAKAAFAIPTTVRSPGGEPVNGFLGFGSMQLKLIEDLPGASFAIVFDSGESSFRNEILSTYKSGRPRLPEGFDGQLVLSRTLSKLLGFDVVDTPRGFEADDVLATLADRARQQNVECKIITADKDLLQVVQDPFVRVLLSKRGVSEYDAYDESFVQARYGVRPDRFVDYRALTGDSSDAIPGVPGVGPVTARKLVNDFGGVEEILSSVNQIHGALRSKIRENADTLRRNLRLLRLTAVPQAKVVVVRPPDIAHWPIDEIGRLMESAGLNSMFKRVLRLVDRHSSHAAESDSAGRTLKT